MMLFVIRFIAALLLMGSLMPDQHSAHFTYKATWGVRVLFTSIAMFLISLSQ